MKTPNYPDLIKRANEHAEMSCPLKDSFKMCTRTTLTALADAIELLANEYLSICDKFCAGDPSVGIQACPFYEDADGKKTEKCLLGGDMNDEKAHGS